VRPRVVALVTLYSAALGWRCCDENDNAHAGLLYVPLPEALLWAAGFGTPATINLGMRPRREDGEHRRRTLPDTRRVYF